MPDSDIQRFVGTHVRLTSSADRRSLLRGLAALTLVGATGAPLPGVSARREDTHADKKRNRKQKSWLCLNGRSIKSKNKRKAKQLRRKGASRGRCTCAPDPPQVTCAGKCGTARNNCGKQVECGFSSVAPVADVQTTFGILGSDPDELQNPHALAVSADERVVYVADFGNNRISVWSRSSASSDDWTNVTAFGDLGPDALNGPAGMALSGDELTLYVADSGNHRITIWTRSNNEVQDWEFAGEFGSYGRFLGEFDGPRGLALTSDERTMYVADSNNGRFSIWSRSSTSSDEWTNQTTRGKKGTGPYELSQPTDLRLSKDDLTIYIADSDNFRVSIWTRTDPNDLDWYFQAKFGTVGIGPDQFLVPSGLALAADELTIWVADTDNNRISVWSRPSTDSQEWSPLRTIGTEGDLPADFNDPLQTRISADSGTLWVVDSLNNRISVWTQTCPA